MNKKVCFFLLLSLTALLTAREIKVSELLLKGGAQVKGQSLLLNGKGAYAEIPGSDSYNLTPAGLTLACRVKLADTRSRDEAASLDTFFSKAGTPFVFARYGTRLAVNLRRENGKTAVKVRGEKIPRLQNWTHATVTWSFLDDTAQGETAYITTLYLDGEKVIQEKHTFFKPLAGRGNLFVGRGYSGPWFLNGEIADIFIEKRALSESEIGKLARKYKKTGPQKKQQFRGVKKIDLKETTLFLRTLPGKGSPIAGMTDKKNGRSVLTEKLFSWQINGTKNGQKLSFHSDNIRFSIKDLTSRGFTAVWKNTSGAAFEAVSRFVFDDDGFSADLKIKNDSPDFLIKEVIYPQVRIPAVSGKDVLFYPYMCGAEIADPTRNQLRYGQSYSYPSAHVTMQYSAYYAGGRGVFLGWQDPAGTIKDFSAAGRYGAVDMTWKLPAVIPLTKQKGGNDFCTPGKIVFKVFSGAWYEAAMLHKKWALAKADWRTALPRKDTPRWFRDIPCSLAPNGLNEKNSNEAVDQLLFLHEYLEKPIYAIWFNWYDKSQRGWPAFPPFPYTEKLFRRIMDAGCHIEPYADSRLWDMQDRFWQTRGRPASVKKEDGSIYTERHGKGTYGVMCPAVPHWQAELLKLSRGIAAISSAVYHDQVMAARGGLCFDPSHGHALNDPALWIREHRKIYQKIHRALPDHPQISEDMSEPYLDLFDGAHVWRWGFQGAVPAFQAVYGGRAQYFALVYDKIARGDDESNFAKMAYSLVNGIKIGRMEVQELFEADEKRLFFKKMTHLYSTLVPWFNEGVMLAPVKFKIPPAQQSLMWSGHWRRNEKVTTPVIVSSSYRKGDKTVSIFVNPTGKPQSCHARISSGWLCLEGAASPVPADGRISLPRRSSAVICSDKKTAKHIQKTLKKIAAFDAGVSYDTRVKFPVRPPWKLKKGELASPDKTVGYFAAYRAEKNGYFFGNINMGGLISWGTVDFGSQKVDEIFLHVAVDKSFSGGKITVLTEDPRGRRLPMGSFTVPGTGGWMKFKKYPVKLTRPFTGKMPVLLRFDRNGCCNFAGWEY